jgi:integrase
MTAVAVVGDRARGYVESIRDSYTSNARTFLTYLDETGQNIGPAALRGYFEWLEGQGYRASTVRIKRQAALDRIRRVAAIPGATTHEQRAKIEWHIHELAREAPSPKLQFPGVGAEKVLVLADYRKVLAGCKSARQAAFLRFLYATGARVAEMVGVRLSGCATAMGVVYIPVMGKGRKERTVRIPEAMFEEIKATFHGSTYLFETSNGKPYARQYVSSQLRTLTKRILGRALSAHKMRHSWATRQLASGKPIDAVSRYLGHSDVAITLKYYAHSEMSNADLFEEDL